MSSLKLDNEFGSSLMGAGSRPQFANLVKYRSKDNESIQKEYPATMRLTNISVQVGANPEHVDPDFRTEINLSGVYCSFRIANESFKTPTFKPDGQMWQGEGDIQFMLASNGHLLVKVVMAGEPEATFGYARLSLMGLGEGNFELTGEIKESEYVTPQDELLGYVMVAFKVVPNFVVTVKKLENQYDTKNLPSLMNVVSQDSKTLSHRIGAFKSALEILHNVIAELQRAKALGPASCKQLSVILNQASSAQGVELFEDLLWDMAMLSFEERIFEPSLTFFPYKPEAEGIAESVAALGPMFDLDSQPLSFALHLDLQDPVVLVADTVEDWMRWTAVLKIACDANSETNAEKAKKLTIPDYCTDAMHPDKPTVGWLKRKKTKKSTFRGDYVRRFFRLTVDADNHYTLDYAHEPTSEAKTWTKVDILEGMRLVLPQMLPSPTPFALSITVHKVSDFSFQGVSQLIVAAQLGAQRQRTRAINPKETTLFSSHLLLPVQPDLLGHTNESVTTVNIGWFGEEVFVPPPGEGPPPSLTFLVGDAAAVNAGTPSGKATIQLKQLPFGRAQELTLPLEGPGAANAELYVSVTMRRLGQYKTAWPAKKVFVEQTGTLSLSEEESWQGDCMVRAAPQGLEIYHATLNQGKPVAVIDYFSIEAVTDINDSTLDVAVIIEQTRPGMPDMGVSMNTPFDSENTDSSKKPSIGKLMRRASAFGMVNEKGKPLSPSAKTAALGATGGVDKGPKTAPNDYFALRISPCPAETLKGLIKERKWMFRDRSMLLYITSKRHDMQLESETPEGTGPVSQDPKIREKLAVAAADTYHRIKSNMSEIIKTANWKHARGVGFTEEHTRMFFRLQRLSCYFAKLLESKACPIWAITGDPDPRGFARKDLDKIFASQYVQTGTFGAEAQGIENSVKGVGHVLRSLNKRLDEVKMFYHDAPDKVEETTAIFFSEYFLRCIGELGAHVISDDILQEVPIEVVVAFVCFLVKRDKAFHELLVENAVEPDKNAFLTTILSIDSMIRRLTKRTELEIVAQWPKDGEVPDVGSYVASLLGDCSPDASGRLSTRAPEELMRLLEKYVQLIASQCQSRGNLGAKIFEGMFFALSSYASNAATTIAKLNHQPCAWSAVRYLSAILNDMSRAGDIMADLISANTASLEGIPINMAAVQSGVFGSGVEVACLLADIALKAADDTCAGFFQADWYSDNDNAVMRTACKQLNRKMEELEGIIHAEPFFQHVVEAGVEKIAFRYLVGFIHRVTDQSGGKFITADELEKMGKDITMMESFLSKYGPSIMTSLRHLKEVMVMMTETPEILQQAVFVDVLTAHEGKEEYVFKLLKICAAARDDLRNFYVPAWLNKLKQKMDAVVKERTALELESDGRQTAIAFDVFEWAFKVDLEKPCGAYIYTYLMDCLKR